MMMVVSQSVSDSDKAVGIIMEDLMQPTFQYDVVPQDTITQMNTEQIEQSFELLL